MVFDRHTRHLHSNAERSFYLLTIETEEEPAPMLMCFTAGEKGPSGAEFLQKNQQTKTASKTINVTTRRVALT